MICPRCTTENEPGRKFCAECGAALAAVCSTCGAANSPGAKFCGECGSPLGAAAPRQPVPAPAVERRLVSVLFADLVGFTSVAESRDAEDVRALLSRYFELARTVVERYGGQLEKFIGDAVMAVWGTPVAREDDAERAVRAALELLPSVAALGADAGAPALSARAAVVTGEAAVTLGAEGQGMVAGDLVNAASRIQGLAEPGTVLVADATRRASEASIAYADAGVHELRGKADAVRLSRALRVTAGRGGSLKAHTLEPPFVGRERELRLLKELFHASADEATAHLVSIVGIAGIGKSRLAQELQRYLDGLAQTVYWHRGRSLAYGEGVSDWALAEMIRMRAGIAEGEEADSAREKLRTALETHVADSGERAWIEPRLAQLLAVDGGELRERSDLVGGWRLFLERLAEHGPVVLVFEDLQWADAPLLEFVAYLLEWSRNHPLLVVGLTRPELEERHPRWASGIRNATTLSLEPLAAPAMEALLDGFVPGLPDEQRGQILARAEGVPLYAVETVRMLLDRGLLERDGEEYRPTGRIDTLGVPESLHALVAARLDGLAADERRLVQDASVVGKTFRRSAVAAVTSVPEPDLDRLLAALVRKEILALQLDPRSPERGQYGFLQDLLRQVAYETMPRAERKARHLAAAAQLEHGDEELTEIVASHYVAALELDPDAADAADTRRKAYATLIKAGERAASLGASENAQRYFEQAVDLTDSALERADLRERAGVMAARAGRPSEARAQLEQAAADLGELGLAQRAARVAARLAVDVTWQHENDIGRAVASLEESFSALAADERDADFAALCSLFARLLYFRGRVDEALARNEVALEIAEALQLPDVLSHALNTKGLVLAKRGRAEEGTLLLRHSLDVALANDVSDAAIRGHVNLTALTVERDRYREALAISRAGAELARRVGERGGESVLDTWAAALRFQLGEWDEADAALRAGLGGVTIWARAALAPLWAHRGDVEEARRLVADAREVADMNETQSRAAYRSIEAEVLLASGDARAALGAAEQAVAAGRELGIADVSVKLALATALEAAVALGDDAKVDALLAVVESAPPGQLTPFLRAVGARFGAHRAVRAGDDATAAAGFAAAARIFTEIESPFEVAVVRLEHAEWLASVGCDDEAEPLLDEAGDVFARLRAVPWVERTAAVRSRLRSGETAR